MSRAIRGSVGVAIVIAGSVGCVSGNGADAGATGTTGSPPTVCEPACGKNASCNRTSTGGVACDCDQDYVPCSDGQGGSACVDRLRDRNNCGGCGFACTADHTCLDGECECALSVCSALDGGLECVDLTSDDNCGGCGITCATNQECATDGDGGATCICVDGGPGVRLQSCNGACADTIRDPFNCGECGNVCTSGSCSADDAGRGVCNCPAPYTQCGEECVNLLTDTYYCGSCDLVCVVIGSLSQQICSDGHCYCGPTGERELCPDHSCTLLRSNPNDCGQCGNVCADPTPDCVDGGCVPG